MKKLVVKLRINGDKDKKKAMNLVTSLSGIDSIAVDMKERKMTVVGDVDPIDVIKKLRKSFYAEILTVKEEKENGEKEKKEGDKNKFEAEQKANNYYNFNYSAEENPNACFIL